MARADHLPGAVRRRLQDDPAHQGPAARRRCRPPARHPHGHHRRQRVRQDDAAQHHGRAGEQLAPQRGRRHDLQRRGRRARRATRIRHAAGRLAAHADGPRDAAVLGRPAPPAVHVGARPPPRRRRGHPRAGPQGVRRHAHRQHAASRVLRRREASRQHWRPAAGQPVGAVPRRADDGARRHERVSAGAHAQGARAQGTHRHHDYPSAAL